MNRLATHRPGMNRLSLGLLTLAVAVALWSAPKEADAAGFAFEAGLGYDVWFKELFVNEEPPSGAEFFVGAGLHVDHRFSVTLRASRHHYRQKVLDTEIELTSYFVDGLGRWHILGEDKLVRPYIGGGFTVTSSSYNQSSSLPNVGDLEDDGIGFGLTVHAGVEVGTSKHMGFAEVGYRLIMSDPVEFADASDYNNMPLLVGYRLRL